MMLTTVKIDVIQKFWWRVTAWPKAGSTMAVTHIAMAKPMAVPTQASTRLCLRVCIGLAGVGWDSLLDDASRVDSHAPHPLFRDDGLG